MGDLVFPVQVSRFATFERSPLERLRALRGRLHFPIWARVKVHARLKRVVATDNLMQQAGESRSGAPEPLDGVPDVLAPAQALEEVVGKNLLRPVHKGATFRSTTFPRR